MVVGVSVTITASTMAARAVSVVVVEVGVVGSGSGFGGGKCHILVELVRAPSADYRGDNEDQYSESNESYHAECSGDSPGVAKEALGSSIGIHDIRG